jgi:hypothetical protein
MHSRKKSMIDDLRNTSFKAEKIERSALKPFRSRPLNRLNLNIGFAAGPNSAHQSSKLLLYKCFWAILADLSWQTERASIPQTL